MIPNQELREEQKNEFNQALEIFKTSEGSDLSYLILLYLNPILEGYFKELIKKDILNFEYGLIDLLVSKDRMIPKIDGKSTLRYLIENYAGSKAHYIIKKLITKSDSIEDDFLDWKFSCPALKNNFTELVFQDDKIKESFLAQLSSSSSEQRDKFFEGLSEKNLFLISLAQLSSSSSEQRDKFFEGLSEENLSLILEAKNEGETLLIYLLKKHILEPSDENKEKIKYIFKKQFKRDLKDEEIPDFVEFTRTYNFFNLFYDKYGQYMHGQSFRSTLLLYLPKKQDLQDDLSKQLLKIYQQIAKRQVADITCKDDTGKQTHLYSYSAKLKGHASYFIFHVNDENKLTKISYCDGHGIPGQEAHRISGQEAHRISGQEAHRISGQEAKKYIHGATTFLLKNPQDFNYEFAQEFIRKNSEGKKVSDFQKEFSEKIKERKIFDYEFLTITQSIPTKIQTRSNCTLKSANILARFFLEQQNQHHQPDQSSLFILDQAQGKVIGEGNKAYKDLKESMSQKVDKKLIEDVKKVPDDFVMHIELFERTNNKWKQRREKNRLEEEVAGYIGDCEFQKINLLLENPEISDLISKFEFERWYAHGQCFGTILTHSVIFCSSESLDLIKKHISKFKLGKDREGDNLLSLLMQGEGNQEEPNVRRFCIEISEILIKHGVSVNDKNEDGKTPLDFCYDPELFKILANSASQETLEKNLRSSIENEHWNEQMFEKDGFKFINIKFLLKERNVKIDGFLDWNFSCPLLKNNFTELVCQDDKIKESFLAQLSSSSSEQRDKFFEGLSEENLSLIKEKLQEQLSKQQEESITFILEKAEERLDSLKNHNEIIKELNHLINPQIEIPSRSDGPIVENKRQREDGDRKTQEIEGGGSETREIKIKVNSCDTAVNTPPGRASS